MKKIGILSISLVLCGCVTSSAELSKVVALPENVVLKQNGDEKYGYLDAINFYYPLGKKTPFGKVAMCVAEKVESTDVVLQDSSASFVGQYTGNFYDLGSVKAYAGKEVFKHIDEKSKTLLARGSAQFSKGIGATTITKHIRYNLKASLKRDTLSLKYINIEGSQQDSGFASNPGFFPIGNWSAAMPLETYNELAHTAEKIQSCLSEN